MDEKVVKYYREILKAGFPHAGSLNEPTILLDAVGENVRICDHVGTDSLKVFISVEDNLIDEIKYLCMCDPTTNVAVEILCLLVSGKSLESVQKLTVRSFLEVLAGDSHDLAKKAQGLIELMDKGIWRYAAASPPINSTDEGRKEHGK